MACHAFLDVNPEALAWAFIYTLAMINLNAVIRSASEAEARRSIDTPNSICQDASIHGAPGRAFHA